MCGLFGSDFNMAVWWILFELPTLIIPVIHVNYTLTGMKFYRILVHMFVVVAASWLANQSMLRVGVALEHKAHCNKQP